MVWKMERKKCRDQLSQEKKYKTLIVEVNGNSHWHHWNFDQTRIKETAMRKENCLILLERSQRKKEQNHGYL